MKILNTLTKGGFNPDLQVLNNAISTGMKEKMIKPRIKVHLVPPGNHLANKVKLAIRTSKKHFIVRTFRINPQFTLQYWDKMVDQEIIYLNMVRISRSNPKISVYTNMFVEFYNNFMPLVLPGIKVMMHEIRN